MKNFESRLQNKILISLKGSFQNFLVAAPSFIYGSVPWALVLRAGTWTGLMRAAEIELNIEEDIGFLKHEFISYLKLFFPCLKSETDLISDLVLSYFALLLN